MKKFKSSASLLLVCLGLNSITSIFIYTFLLAHIIDISANSIVNVAVFYLVLHISMIILSIVFAPLFKKLDKSLLLKIGIGVKFIFVLIVTFMGDSILKYIYLVSMCDALSEVVFWAGANALIPKATDNQSMQQFLSFESMIGKIISIIIPPIIGMWIDKSGIKVLSIVMIFVVAAQLITSIFIKENWVEQSSKLQYKDFIRAIKETNNKTVKLIYINMIFLGICSNIGTLVLFFTYTTYNSNVSLGVFSTITSIATIAFLAIFNIKKSVFKKNIPFIIYTCVVCVSLLLIILNLNKITLIIFTLAWNLGNVVPGTVASAQRLEIVQNPRLVFFNVENMTISEVFLDLGRVIGEIALLLMGIFANNTFNIFIICGFIAVIIMHYITTYKLVKKTEYIVSKVNEIKK